MYREQSVERLCQGMDVRTCTVKIRLRATKPSQTKDVSEGGACARVREGKIWDVWSRIHSRWNHHSESHGATNKTKPHPVDITGYSVSECAPFPTAGAQSVEKWWQAARKEHISRMEGKTFAGGRRNCLKQSMILSEWSRFIGLRR